MQVFLYFCQVKRKKIEFRSTCPISTALDIFGDKWSLLIIRDLVFNEKSTYGEFLNSEEKIATNILADRLALLEAGGIISKHSHPEHKLKVLYKLTQKGLELIPVLIEIIAWSEKHHEVHPYAKQFAKQIRKDKEGVIKSVMEGLRVR
jgi:DNA-binding HxlR family transcriptional regulator